jgi:metal-sulfur cluster biosynthetic enzyme
MMVKAETVRQALSQVCDPILGQSLVDLGMVQAVRVARRGQVRVDLALPSPHWPASAAIVQAVQEAIAGLPGVAAVEVQPVDQPPWNPYRLAPALKAPLGLPAAEPPPPFSSLSPSPRGVRRLLGRLVSR